MLMDKLQFQWVGAITGRSRDALVFAVCYLVLDWTSCMDTLGPFNITPWYPAPALSIVCMTLAGLRYAPFVYVLTFASDVLIRNAPGGLIVSALTSMVLAAGCAAMAASFRHFLKPDYRLNNTRQVWIFVAITLTGTAITAITYVGFLSLAGFFISEPLESTVFRFWLGN